jgi:hypothetical protein
MSIHEFPLIPQREGFLHFFYAGPTFCQDMHVPNLNNSTQSV